jgi:dTDP-4-amino-4,6-dideoxygalactose transaminase
MSETHAATGWDNAEPDAEPLLDEGQVIDLREHRETPPRGGRQVAFVDLVAAHQDQRDEILAAMHGVMDRGDFVLGEDIAKLEREFAAYCGALDAVGVDSGFSALELILRAFDVGPGDEVITPANTFHATVRAIEACGARPVLVDADPISRNIDPSLIEPAITSATRAILPVHLYGHPADMVPINELARAYGLLVFEDACQAHGSGYYEARAGALADAAAFSFYPTKNLGAFGDAGMVVTRHDHIADRIRRLRNLGSSAKNQHDERGFNRRLDTLQAAVLRVKLRHLDDANEARRRVAHWYQEALRDLDLTLPRIATWAVPVFHLYVIEADDRDALAIDLAEQGVHTGIHYPVPIHLQPAFSSLGLGPGAFPVSEELAGRILSLPMHPGMAADDVDHVAEAIRRSRGTRARRIRSDHGGSTDTASVPSPSLHAG